MTSKIVLIHGSFHGSWCWNRVETRLTDAGLAVESVDLPKIDEPSTRLTDHIRFLINAVGTQRVTLVGHSYAGMALAAVAEKTNTSHCVYVDAFVPRCGDTAFGLLGEIGEELRSQVAARADNLIAPPPAAALGLLDADQAAYVQQRLRPMAAGTHDEESSVDATGQASWRSSYIACTNFPLFAEQASRARAAGWTVREIQSGHDVMLLEPDALARALIELESQAN